MVEIWHIDVQMQAVFALVSKKVRKPMERGLFVVGLFGWLFGGLIVAKHVVFTSRVAGWPLQFFGQLLHADRPELIGQLNASPVCRRDGRQKASVIHWRLCIGDAEKRLDLDLLRTTVAGRCERRRVQIIDEELVQLCSGALVGRFVGVAVVTARCWLNWLVEPMVLMVVSVGRTRWHQIDDDAS